MQKNIIDHRKLKITTSAQLCITSGAASGYFKLGTYSLSSTTTVTFTVGGGGIVSKSPR